VLILGEGEGVNEEGETISLETQEVEEEEEEVECKVIGVLGSMGEYNTMKIGGKLEKIDWWYWRIVELATTSSLLG
jgi:hypothetical protein